MDSIEKILHLDPQAAVPAAYCRLCGREVYRPGFYCLHCQREAP